MGYVIIPNGELPQGYFVTDTCNKPRIGLTVEENGQTKTSYIPLCTTTTVQNRRISQFSISGSIYNVYDDHLGLNDIQTYYTYYPLDYYNTAFIPKAILDSYAFKLTNALSYTSTSSGTESMTKTSFIMTAVTHSITYIPGNDLNDMNNNVNSVYNAGGTSSTNNAATYISSWGNSPVIPLFTYSDYINVTRFTHNDNITSCTYTTMLPYGFPLASFDILSHGIEFTITTLTGYIIDMVRHNIGNTTTQKISSSYQYKLINYSDTQFMTNTSSIKMQSNVNVFNGSTTTSVTRTFIGTSYKGLTIYRNASYYKTYSYTFEKTNNCITHNSSRFFVCPLGTREFRNDFRTTMFERYTTTTWI